MTTNTFEQVKSAAHKQSMECIIDRDGAVCIRHMLFDDDGGRIVRHAPDPCEFNLTLAEAARMVGMNAKHTPGPWSASGQAVYAGHAGQGHAICICPDVVEPAQWMGHEHGGPIEADGGQHEDTQAANARLIAAAPDLLAALSILLRTCQDASRHAWNRTEIDAIQWAAVDAQAAIAKAKGA